MNKCHRTVEDICWPNNKQIKNIQIKIETKKREKQTHSRQTNQPTNNQTRRYVGR